MGWIVINSAVKRGGNWDNGADAGPFCANLNNLPTDTNNNIGFRCCNSSQSQIHIFTEIMNSARELHQFKSKLKKLNIKIKTGG